MGNTKNTTNVKQMTSPKRMIYPRLGTENVTIQDKIDSRIRESDCDCWHWIGKTMVVTEDGKQYGVRKFLYGAEYDTVRYHVYAACLNKSDCVNPDHLRLKSKTAPAAAIVYKPPAGIRCRICNLRRASIRNAKSVRKRLRAEQSWLDRDTAGEAGTEWLRMWGNGDDRS